MKRRRFYVQEQAVYANLYIVEAESREEAIEIVKRGDALIEHSQFVRVLPNEYTAKPAPSKQPDTPGR
jgi:hypothetical protein